MELQDVLVGPPAPGFARKMEKALDESNIPSDTMTDLSWLSGRTSEVMVCGVGSLVHGDFSACAYLVVSAMMKDGIRVAVPCQVLQNRVCVDKPISGLLQ